MATKTRVNITFDDDTLRLADREARRRKMSRSALVRDLIRTVALNGERESAEEARRKRQLAAIEGMRELARKAGPWPAAEILHSWRYRLQRKEK